MFNLLLRAVVQNMHLDSRVVQRRDMCPGIIQHVRGLVTHGEVDIDGGVISVLVGLEQFRRVVFGVEVLTPHGNAKI